MVDILILGATGYSGQLVAEYLQQHPQRPNFTFAIAGRSQSKLEAIKKKYHIDDSVPIIIVDVTSYEDVEKAVQGTKVVINAVGPYFRWGTPVVRACARLGKHYVDLTGEQYWVLDMIYAYHYLATKTRSIIIPGCAFDSIPSDISVFLANKTLKGFVGPESEIETSLSAWKVSSGISGGTLSTLFSTFDEVPRHKLVHATMDHALSSSIGEPSPPSRLVYSLPFSRIPVYGGLWPMKFANRAIVQRTWGLLECARLSKGASSGSCQLSYGPKFKYDEFMVTPSKFSALLLSAGFSLFMLALAIPPIRWLIKNILPQPGEGPTGRGGSLTLTNVTSSVPTASKPQTHVRTTLRAKGDGYETSAVMVAESALALALQHRELPSLAHGGGILTPAAALGDVLVKRLEKSGRFSFESEVILEGEDRKRR